VTTSGEIQPEVAQPVDTYINEGTDAPRV